MPLWLGQNWQAGHMATGRPALALPPSGDNLLTAPHAELGIDIPQILRSTKAILLHQMKSDSLDELDFGGALVFLLVLGVLHLMVRLRSWLVSSHTAHALQICSCPILQQSSSITDAV